MNFWIIIPTSGSSSHWDTEAANRIFYKKDIVRNCAKLTSKFIITYFYVTPLGDCFWRYNKQDSKEIWSGNKICLRRRLVEKEYVIKTNFSGFHVQGEFYCIWSRKSEKI